MHTTLTVVVVVVVVVGVPQLNTLEGHPGGWRIYGVCDRFLKCSLPRHIGSHTPSSGEALTEESFHTKRHNTQDL